MKDVESALSVEKKHQLLGRRLGMSAPGDLAEQRLHQYMQIVCNFPPNGFASCLDLIQAPTHAFFYDLCHNLDRFREDFDAKYKTTPHIKPMLRWRWSALYLAYYIRS